MKKIYLKPETIEYKVEIENHLLAASNGLGLGFDDEYASSDEESLAPVRNNFDCWE